MSCSQLDRADTGTSKRFCVHVHWLLTVWKDQLHKDHAEIIVCMGSLPPHGRIQFWENIGALAYIKWHCVESKKSVVGPATLLNTGLMIPLECIVVYWLVTILWWSGCCCSRCLDWGNLYHLIYTSITDGTDGWTHVFLPCVSWCFLGLHCKVLPLYYQ